MPSSSKRASVFFIFILSLFLSQQSYGSSLLKRFALRIPAASRSMGLLVKPLGERSAVILSEGGVAEWEVFANDRTGRHLYDEEEETPMLREDEFPVRFGTHNGSSSLVYYIEGEHRVYLPWDLKKIPNEISEAVLPVLYATDLATLNSESIKAGDIAASVGTGVLGACMVSHHLETLAMAPLAFYVGSLSTLMFRNIFSLFRADSDQSALVVSTPEEVEAFLASGQPRNSELVKAALAF